MSDLPPPPYSASSPGSAAAFSPALGGGGLSPSLYTSHHLAAHLSTLPGRLRESHDARATRQAADDLDVVERILPHVEAFLADIVSQPRPPRAAAELAFVPAPAVPAPWSLSGAAERRREGDLVQLVRLDLPDPAAAAGGKGGGGGDSKGAAGSTGADGDSGSGSLRPERDWGSRSENLFDEWGRWGDDAASAGDDGKSSWWWRDEGAARRLAGYLQPGPGVVRTERRAVQAAVVEEKRQKKSGWGWGRRKGGGGGGGGGGESSASTTPTSPNPQVSPSSPGMDQDERVNMVVRADEITFRKENEFGVWESMSGWGIVVVVTIRR